jgi:hypothetical protein
MKMRIDDFRREDNTIIGGYRDGIIHHRGHGEHGGRKKKDNAEARRAQRIRREEGTASITERFASF